MPEALLIKDSDDLGYLAPAISVFNPPPDEDICEWVEGHIILPERTCPEPGPFRFERTPYCRGPLRAYVSVYVEVLNICFGRQVAKTQGVQYPAMAYEIARDPGPGLFMLPTKPLAYYSVKQRILPMLMQCDEVLAKMTDVKSDITKAEMSFIDSVINFIGAETTAETMSRPIRYLNADEIDEFKETAGNTSDPLGSALQTTTAFSNRKIMKTSTPTTEDGRIWQGLKGSQLVFEFWVPCPKCKGLQILVWEQIKFDVEAKDFETVARNTHYECAHCAEVIRENQKSDIVNAGVWRARLAPEAEEGADDWNAADAILAGEGVAIDNTIALDDALQSDMIVNIGFHLPKWYGLFYNCAWGQAAKEFLEANRALKDGRFEVMRDWVKFWRALPYVDKIEAKDARAIQENEIDLQRFMCPAGSVAVTAGFDQGQGGYWYILLAWPRMGPPHVIDHGFVGTKAEMRAIVFENSYPVAGSEHRLRVWRAGLDTGGSKYGDQKVSMTEDAYIFLRQYGAGRIYGTKGAGGQYNLSGKKMKQSKIDKMPKGAKIRGGLILWILDTDGFKESVQFRLQTDPEEPDRHLTLFADIDPVIARHLASEVKQRQKNGKYKWEKKFGANHYLDCMVIAFAMADAECLGGVSVLATAQTVITPGQPKRGRIRHRGYTKDDILGK